MKLIERTTVSGSVITIGEMCNGSLIACTRKDGKSIIIGALRYFKDPGVWAMEPNREYLIAYAPETLRAVADILESENE